MILCSYFPFGSILSYSKHYLEIIKESDDNHILDDTNNNTEFDIASLLKL